MKACQSWLTFWALYTCILVLLHEFIMNHTKLTNKKRVAEGSFEFSFERPEGFMYRAGQYIDLTDSKGATRSFTLSSAPFEHDLRIATRVTDSDFKRSLEDASLGTMFTFDGPFGSMILHNNITKPAVMFAGGIGITPFRSMIAQALYERTAHEIYLFYSNRKPEDAVFLNELQQCKGERLRFIPTMTNMVLSNLPWYGERGYINEDMLKKTVSDLSVPIYYIAGPPRMVSGIYQMLVKLSIDTDIIRSEEFAGY
jgi:ferredoxin-NADP reductase